MYHLVFCLPKRMKTALSTASAMMLALSVPAFAQGESNVLLQSADGNVSVIGQLLNVDDQFFTIEGKLGLLNIPRENVTCTGTACPIEGEIPIVAPLLTRQVSLNSIDDETKVRGELIDVEENHYIIRNALGEFRVTIASVECVGAACPTINRNQTDFNIMVETPELGAMLVDLLTGYAVENGQTAELSNSSVDTQTLQFAALDNQSAPSNVNVTVRAPNAAVAALSNRSADILVYGQQRIEPPLQTSTGIDDLLQTPLAFDGEVIVAHHDNPVRDLSLSEINQIWRNDLTSWQALGGANANITLHMLADEATSEGWLNGLRASSTPGVVIHDNEEQVLAAVNSDKNALGLVHRTSAEHANAKMVAVRNVCGLVAEPTDFGIRSQHYPFTQSFYSYGRASGQHPFIQNFLEWTQTQAAAEKTASRGYTTSDLQRIKIRDMGVAVVHTAAVEPDFDGVEFSTMMRELRSADRLSMTFRFLTGSSVLDEESQFNIKELAKRIQNNEFNGQEVVLVGFADSTGPAGPNSALSARRAQTVQDVLGQEFDAATLAQLNFTPLGFGEQMPVDCNNTDIGRANNRRVEVWVRNLG
jgi:phosphate transport system substrate-binding protein